MTLDELKEMIESLAGGLKVSSGELRKQLAVSLENCGEELLLIKGDLSGIQKYLYSVNASEDAGGGIAKRLRGRSFYLSAICHALAHELTDLVIPGGKILHAAGGKFLVVQPWSAKNENEIAGWKEKIDLWLWTETWGELALNLAWLKCRREDLDADFSEHVALPLQEQLDTCKLQKFLPLWRNGIHGTNSGWDSFPVYRESYPDECHSCKSLPVAVTENNEEKNLCRECLRLQRLGGYLNAPERSHLDFFAGKVAETQTTVNFHENHAVLRESESSFSQIAGYVPQWPFSKFASESQAGCSAADRAEGKISLLCGDCPIHQSPPPEDCGKNKERLVTRFHCLATLGSVKNDGASKIAVLAADGDEFSYHLNSTPGITLSDQMLLGKLIYVFFSQHLIGLLKQHDGLLVYSGGDDFVVVGPWADVIRIANQLRQQFAEWTKGRLHFSAGIHITNPQEPIYESISTAQDYLREAKKERRKNAVQIEATCIPWRNFDTVFEFAEDLSKAEKAGVISIAFIYGLYRICEDHERFERDNEVRGLRYLSRLASHVSRNLKLNWDDAEKARLAEKLRQSFENHLLNPKDKTLLPYWRFALDWAALQGREK